MKIYDDDLLCDIPDKCIVVLIFFKYESWVKSRYVLYGPGRLLKIREAVLTHTAGLILPDTA
jgi:hypothetical protein